jgi:LmbE family N-acetylglucosaminyl deacetylase
MFAVLVLFATTVLWALLGARLQSHNADQLSDPYLFSNLKTFHGAAFPGAHTMLLKWPIFWLVAAFGVTPLHLLVATVATVVVTVATLAVVLYKIDRRPLTFGTICLGLSLALLLVPAQPYAGGLLPVNMAMLTTRNIEYAVYLVVLVLFARAARIKTWSFAVGAVLLTLLVASDKLFLSLSLGGALLALLVYAGLRAWKFVTFAVHWLVGSLVAAVGAAAILAGLSAAHVTHIVNSGAASPYNLVSGVQNIALGAAYSILGLFTNAGANPVYDNLVLRRLPGSLEHRLWSLSGPAYVVAALTLVYALLLAWRIAWQAPHSKPRTAPPAATLLALGLIWSTVAAYGVFIVTKHYYAVDARYLTVGLFALTVSVSVGLRRSTSERPAVLLLIAVVLVAAITIAASTSIRISDHQTAALSDVDNRNTRIAAVLQQHKVKLLVGDYWRVLPVKFAMKDNVNVMPLATCTQPESVLTSTVWQPDLHKTSFAYLLTLSGSLTGFPNCTVKQAVAAYGRPNATQLIAGKLGNPAEMILFYDRGSHPDAAPTKAAAAKAVLPITPDQLSDTGCVGYPTIVNVVAHQDDDLLFLNPDLQHEIQAGDCVRTVFITAGNDGQGRPYWLSRQLGSEAAYSTMIGAKGIWVQHTVELAKNEYVTVANPGGNHKVSLIFMNLPDGNLDGQGFPMSNYESLTKLQNGTIAGIQTVDGQSSYTASQLVKAIAQLMELYRPSEVHTQADLAALPDPDHPDHIATSKFTQAAATVYDQEEFVGQVTTPLKRYIGYPIQTYPANVSGTDLAEKQAAFFAYGRFDTGVCTTAIACQSMTYGAYLARQYTE